MFGEGRPLTANKSRPCCDPSAKPAKSFESSRLGVGSGSRGRIRGQIEVDQEPVSHDSDPEFSWRFEVSPAALGFMSSGALGAQYRGDMSPARPGRRLLGGQLCHFDLTRSRRKIAVDDPRLKDHVADNTAKFDITESESLLFGKNSVVGFAVLSRR